MIFNRFNVGPRRPLVLLLLCTLGAASAYAGGAVSLASVSTSGAGGNGGSAGARLSAGGRFLVFSSDAGDLVANDTNGRTDVFVRDLLLGATRMVSVSRTGSGGGDGDSYGAVISADGRYVVFTSFAGNLVADDANSLPDLFVRDLAAGTTRLVSVNRAGTGGGNGPTLSGVDPVVTPDGRFVAFYSAAGDLAANDTNNATDLFLRDTAAGTTSIVSVNTAGRAAGIGLLAAPAVSADGRFVAFQSEAGDLVANDPQRAGGNQDADVFVRDVAAGTTSLVSLNRAGTASGNAPSRFPAMSADGRFVVFESYATDLAANDSNLYRDVYVRDRAAGVTVLASVNRAGATGGNPSNTVGAPAISADGRYVAFASAASDLVTGDANGRTDVFLRDLEARTTTLVSRNSTGTSGGNDDSQNPVVSADGRFVAFQSLATDLTGAGDSNGRPDVFVRDVQRGVTALASSNAAGTASANDGSAAAALSADGQVVAFQSAATDLVAGDANRLTDVFVYPGAFPAAPKLITEGGTGRAVALDSVTFARDPFPVMTNHNFSPDRRTRVTLFATRLEVAPGEKASVVTAQAEDAQRRIYPLTVEHVGAVPNLHWVTQVVVKLPAELEGAGDVRVSLTLRGAASNKAVIKIKPSEIG